MRCSGPILTNLAVPMCDSGASRRGFLRGSPKERRRLNRQGLAGERCGSGCSRQEDTWRRGRQGPDGQPAPTEALRERRRVWSTTLLERSCRLQCPLGIRLGRWAAVVFHLAGSNRQTHTPQAERPGQQPALPYTAIGSWNKKRAEASLFQQSADVVDGVA